MIQDIFPKIYNNNYYPDKEPDDKAVCMIFKENEVVVAHAEAEGKKYIPQESASSFEMDVPAGDISFPLYGQIKEYAGEYRYLFSIGDEEYYLITHYKEGFEPDWDKMGYAYEHYKALRHATPKYKVFALMTAYHLHCWYRDNTFCGRCGERMFHDTRLRALRCPECGGIVFPRISPAVIVGVHDGKRLLMTKYNGRDYKGYALIAGFVEIGESAEDTVRREVFEEVGVHVKNVTYYGSQPWGFDGNLMLGYTARLDGSHTIHLDQTELSKAVWLKPEEIPDIPDYSSLTREMIRRFKNHCL